jgi:4-deoxy-L-threo-5-hexosulose-uronate ketol-isomerase
MNFVTVPGPAEMQLMTTRDLRGKFLIERLFERGKIAMVYTNLDRLIAGGVSPQDELRLPAYDELAASSFTERREIGVINIGDAGEISVAGKTYELAPLDCLYIGIGEPDIVFRSLPGGEAVFYLLSAPAHRKFPTCKATPEQASVHFIGSVGTASRRKLVQYIHEDGIGSCQLVMGYTTLEAGSVWNTWPPHTHPRRSEIYLYFGLGENPLIHLVGEPHASRHLVVRDRQSVLSPSWSIHTGVGTGPYSFIWGMAGENQAFADMDPVDLNTFA